MERKGSLPAARNPFGRAVALWRAMNAGGERVLQRASYLHEVVKVAPVEIEPLWTLAGNHLPTVYAWQRVSPDPGNDEHVAQLRELGLGPDDFEAVGAAQARWDGVAEKARKELCPGAQPGLGYWGDNCSKTVFWAAGWIENHSIRDYAKAIRIGFNGLRAEIEQARLQADPSSADFGHRDQFWQAALQVCDAGTRLGKRYAQKASALAREAGAADDKARLDSIAAACSRVPADGARTLAEATQALWLLHILTCGEDGINANSLGRVDQILYPYYAADLEAGRIDRAGAVALMEELACRLYLEYDVQAITLGGVDGDGNDAANEMSYIILEATRDVGFVRDLSVRLHDRSPAPFVRLASELMARGGGIPFIFNDDCFIPALTERGIALEHARDYAPIGCIELTIPGKANPHAVSGWFNSLKCLELALFNGKDPKSGEQLGPATGELDGFGDFEEFFDAYTRQVEYFAQGMVAGCNAGELAQQKAGPLPCWSVMTDDCIQRGRDITDGGPVYNYHSICFLGVPNTADAMMAIKKLMFEDKAVGPAEFRHALTGNFRDCEAVRQKLLHGAPKYGNDKPEVDDLARRVAVHFIDLMDDMRSPLNGRYFVHLFSFVANISFGKTVGATPDGRCAGEPLAYSLSAHQGRDMCGVTALLNSLARLPHDKAAGATAAIVDVDPAMVQGEAGVERLKQLVQTSVAMKIGQLQWNVTSVERLKQAREDPEKYGNIAVRVAGYSQMFKLVDKELQDHIIARTKHRT